MASRATRNAITTMLLLAACRDNDSTPGPVEPLRANATAVSAPGRPRRDAEAHLVEIERVVPGFGGYYADKNGVLHVWVTQRIQNDRARAAVASQFATGRVPALGRSTPLIVVDSARFTFGQLADWRELLLERASSGELRQIRVLDVDETLNRVRLEVDGDVGAVRQAMATLEIDSAAVVIEAYTPLRYTRRQSYPSTINSVVSPLVGGIGIRWDGPFQAGGCTLGFVASVAGTKRFVTAAHCTEIQYAVDSAVISQPFVTPAGTRIGTEISDPTPSNCYLSYYAFWARCRASDAALFSVASGVQAEVGLIARTTTRSQSGSAASGTTLAWDQTNPYWVIDAVEQNNWYVGLAVDKAGLTSGWTWGIITNSCEDYLGEDGQKGVTCAYRADMHIEAGDSGGPVFYIHPEGGSRVTLGGTIIGIKGGRAVFSKFARINSDLGGNLVATRVPTLATPVLTGTLIGASPSISWPATTGATYYRVYRQWYRYPTETGSAGWELFTVTTNSFVDPDQSAEAYTGGTQPNFTTAGYVKYQVRPMSALESGGTSNIVNFRLAP